MRLYQLLRSRVVYHVTRCAERSAPGACYGALVALVVCYGFVGPLAATIATSVVAAVCLALGREGDE